MGMGDREPVAETVYGKNSRNAHPTRGAPPGVTIA